MACGIFLGACGPGRDALAEQAVLKVTLMELFATREHAQAITVWHDPRQQAPTLSAFGGPWGQDDTLALQVVDTTALGLPFRVERITLGEMEHYFREHPKGWDAWFAEHQGNAGVVEVVTPRMFQDSAVVYIGRACGELCRSAWRVTVGRRGDRWAVSRVDVLKVP
jgi:hypothetical protein